MKETKKIKTYEKYLESNDLKGSDDLKKMWEYQQKVIDQFRYYLNKMLNSTDAVPEEKNPLYTMNPSLYTVRYSYSLVNGYVQTKWEVNGE